MRLKGQQGDDSIIYLNQSHESNKLVIRGNKKTKRCFSEQIQDT